MKVGDNDIINAMDSVSDTNSKDKEEQTEGEYIRQDTTSANITDNKDIVIEP